VAGATSTLLAEAIRSNPGLAQSQVVVLEMQLDSTGRVVEAHVAESSGDTRADALALRVARLAVFHPAIINRKRSAVEVSFPVRLRVGRAPPRRGRRPR
jgi:TonB family protein